MRVTGRKDLIESTDGFVISIFKSIEATVSINEIDRSHRIGKPG